jgi:uncharacterized repeat protein (TIGR03806 family)
MPLGMGFPSPTRRGSYWTIIMAKFFAKRTAALWITVVIVVCGGVWWWLRHPAPKTARRIDLERRVPVTGLQFPPDNPHRTPLRAVRAFPKVQFDEPLFLTAPADGTDRIFVLEKKGRILAFPNSDEVPEAKVFLDLSARVDWRLESGLLGLAFDPKFTENRRFYVYYTAGNPFRVVLSSFLVRADDLNAADPASEKILIELPKEAVVHHGGMLAFGPDGMLYVSVGDGAYKNGNTAAQDLTSILGKVLRIDPSGGTPYAIPRDNPFVGRGGGVREEIWAYGLRNPWRFSFDSRGRLWLGDVGENTVEEVNLITRGANLGWRAFEGTQTFLNDHSLEKSQVSLPILDYTHIIGGSVIGGYVSRGARLGSMRDAYIYGDGNLGRVWAMRYDGQKVVSNDEVSFIPALASFGEDAQGEMFAVALDGKIYRFEETAALPATQPFPSRLSETGLFRDTAKLAAAPGVVEYAINAPGYNDGATARRWMALPGEERIAFHAKEHWQFPMGTVLVQHLEMGTTDNPAQRLDTRVLVHEQSGWAGYTYKWNADQKDAQLLVGSRIEKLLVPKGPLGGSRERDYLYPSSSDCLRCHGSTNGAALSLTTRQLNRIVQFTDGPENQLQRWEKIGLLAGSVGEPAKLDALLDPHDTSHPRTVRVRSYLDTNCSHCHRPGGAAQLGIDMRFDTPLDLTNMVNVRPVRGSAAENGRFFVITPGKKRESMLRHRMLWDNVRRMPPISSGVRDPLAESLIGKWIDNDL